MGAAYSIRVLTKIIESLADDGTAFDDSFSVSLCLERMLAFDSNLSCFDASRERLVDKFMIVLRPPMAGEQVALLERHAVGGFIVCVTSFNSYYLSF